MKLHPPVWLFLSGLVATTLAKTLPIFTFDTPTVIVLGAFLIGAVFLAFALASFVKNKTTVNPHTPEKTAVLVTDGIYRVTRNPMYVGMLFLLISLILWLGALSAFVAAIGFFFIIDSGQIKYEEEALHELFGDAFKAYKQHVPKWLFFTQ